MLILSTVLVLAASNPATESKCKYLEDLNRQYAGMQLSAYERQVKQQMVAWYRANCQKKG